MRVKAPVIVFLVVVLSLCAWVYARAQGAPASTGMQFGPNGRYQVVTAELDFSAFGGQLKQKTAIKIDTQTGQAWRLQETVDKKGGRYWEWEAIEDVK